MKITVFVKKGYENKMNETDTLKQTIKEYEDAFHEILEQNNLCQFLDESELAGIAVYHYLNNIHYGKVGNLYKANLFFESIIEHIKNNLTRYEILLDEY